MLFSSKQRVMAMNRMLLAAAMAAMFLGSCVGAQSLAPAPAPSSDGTSIDQGIAYALMIAALLLTYLIHPLDAFPYGLF